MNNSVSYSAKQLDPQQFNDAAEKAQFHRDILTEVFQCYRNKDRYEKNARGYLEKELFFTTVWALNVHQVYQNLSCCFLDLLEQKAIARTIDGRSSIPFTGEERNLKPIERAVRSVVREYVLSPLFELLSRQELKTGINMHCSFSGSDDIGNTMPNYLLYSHEERDMQEDFFQKPFLVVDISSREAFETSIAKQKEEAQQRRWEELLRLRPKA